MTDSPKKPERSWWTSPRQLLRMVLCLDDTPHRIALGTAIGMFIGWTPTVGMQMLLVLLVAALARPFFRFNHFAGLVAVYVSNPITTVPMYWLMYCVGTIFVAGRATYAQFTAVLKYESWSGWLATLRELFVVIGLPLIVGSLILATFFGLLTYPLMRFLLAPRRRPATAPHAQKAPSRSVDPPPAVRTRKEERETSVTKDSTVG